MNFRNRVFKIKISQLITPQLVEKVSDSLDKWTFYKPIYIALIINSPGGSLIQTQTLAIILKNFSLKHKVPIYSFGEDIVIQSALGLLTIADKVYVNPYAITGNIGYSNPFFNIKEFAQKWFIQNKQITSNDNMKLLNPFNNLQQEDQQFIENHFKFQEEELINMIEENRKLQTNTKEQRIKEIYQNGLISPKLLYSNGIIDGYDGFDTVLQGKKIYKLI